MQSIPKKWTRRAMMAACMTAAFVGYTDAWASDLQSQRLAFMQKLVNRGIFTRIEMPGSLPHAWVGVKFRALDFDTKRAFCSAVLAYYYVENPSANILVLKDDKTGKRIGSMSAADGQLQLD